MAARATIEKKWRFGTIPCANGKKSETLRFARYCSSEVKPDHCVVFLNGRTEFIEKYADLPRDLGLPATWSFLTWDHRGQGASAGASSHIDSYETFARDAQRIVDHQVSFDTPYTIVAHSMGALIALYAVMKQYLKPQQLILTSPLLGLPNHPLPRVLSQPLAVILSHMGMAGFYIDRKIYPKGTFPSNLLTHDEIKFQRLKNSPYPSRSVTFGWLQATYQALSFVHSAAALRQLDIPIFILTAEQEQVVDPRAAENFVVNAGKSCTQTLIHKQIAKAKHELLFEEEFLYQQALSAIRGWLNQWRGDIEMSDRSLRTGR
jgi:lysophospholipase